MADLDLSQPLPDRAHEGIRQAVVQAIEDLGNAQADTGDSLYLVDVLFELLDTAMVAVDDLTARVEALETPEP